MIRRLSFKSCSSAPRRPTRESPSGQPSSVANGRLIRGKPPSPAIRAPDHVGARDQQSDRLGGFCRRRVGAQPVRVAEAGAVAGDVKDVLDRHGEARELTSSRPAHCHVIIPAERPDRIVYFVRA
jgi:hypothetical protein